VHANPAERSLRRACAGSTSWSTGCAIPGAATGRARSSLLKEEDFVSASPGRLHPRGGNRQGIHPRRRRVPVVLSQRMSVPFRARPVDVYRALRALNRRRTCIPRPRRHQVVGSSPEILVRVQDGEITCARSPAPPRGATRPKTRRWKPNCWPIQGGAQHLMLIDLGATTSAASPSRAASACRTVPDRALFARSCTSVRSAGTLRAEVNSRRAQGTFRRHVSGAPKIPPWKSSASRADQAQHLFRRGRLHRLVGDVDTAIAIRTAVIQDGAARAGRRRHRLRLGSREGMGRDDEQGQGLFRRWHRRQVGCEEMKCY